MSIAVTTPTGNVGRHVVATLVRAGVRPRVLLRDPARLAPEVRNAVDAVPVDQYDADAVVAATADLDALFWVNRPAAAGIRSPNTTAPPGAWSAPSPRTGSAASSSKAA